MSKNLSQFLNDGGPILLDGAMGTQLAEMDLPMGGQNNLSHPESVLEIHQAYSDCGCDILTTNTLTMNRIYIEAHNLGIDVQEVNQVGAHLARTVAGETLFVLGDMSSTGKILQPYGELAESDAYNAYIEQAASLADGDVDGFIIETVYDLNEALCAIRACNEIADLPILCTISFTTSERGGRTIMGNSARDCAEAITDAGAKAVGVNCGDLDPFQTAEVIALLREWTTLPLIAQPNAGKPRLIGDQTVFDMDPSVFAEGIEACQQAGASLLGGCCGTTPEHISAVAKILGKSVDSRQ
ncbi:MAG: hypothetical protein GTO18_22035 [Anaerolineales bacterium]|nr:hypothetical protein [Anaerolineales bacterium]